jgi:hypothetical protein
MAPQAPSQLAGQPGQVTLADGMTGAPEGLAGKADRTVGMTERARVKTSPNKGASPRSPAESA